jgi:hypothetical protein
MVFDAFFTFSQIGKYWLEGHNLILYDVLYSETAVCKLSVVNETISLRKDYFKR